MTPTHGTPLSPDQAAYDADQDARIRRLRAQGLALGAVLAALIVVAVARTSSRWAVGDLPTSVVDQAEADIADVRVYSDAKSAAWWEARYARGLGHYRGQ